MANNLTTKTVALPKWERNRAANIVGLKEA
jgi:hypothetical protein